MVELLCSLAAQRANGRLELRQGKKRRGFYFEGGKVSLTKSNLKSESTARLQELHPTEGETTLHTRQARLRLMNAMSASEGEFEFRPNVPPKERRPVDLMPVVWKAIERTMQPDAIDQRLAGLGSRFPMCSPQGVALEDLPLGEILRDFIYTLDGSRSLDEVLEFLPTEPELAKRALYLALITGVVSFPAEESGISTSVSGQPAQDLDTPPNADQGLDLSALIAAEVGENHDPFAEDDDADPFGDAADDPFGDEDSEGGQDSDEAQAQALRVRLETLEAAENYFEVLGIHWDADHGDYRKAYLALANELHPDRWQGRSPEVQDLVDALFAKIGEAWETLGDEDRRTAYIQKEIHGIKSEDELAMEKVQAILAAEDVFKAGLALFRRGKISAAHERFKEAHDMVPEEAEFQAFFGYTTWKQTFGKDDMAANDAHMMVERAVESHVKLDSGLVLLGLIYKGKGQPKRALASLKAALEMNPNNPDAELQIRRLVADTQRKQKKKAEAEKKSKGLFGRFFGGKK